MKHVIIGNGPAGVVAAEALRKADAAAEIVLIGAEPEEIAPVFVFFASDASAYVTGQILAADGGMTIH